MGDLTIDDIEDDLMDALKRRAAAHGRSMEAEAEAILRDSVNRAARPEEPMPDRTATIQELCRFRESLPPITALPLTQDLPREDCDR